jgi:hypothetical protein
MKRYTKFGQRDKSLERSLSQDEPKGQDHPLRGGGHRICTNKQEINLPVGQRAQHFFEVWVE